MRLVARRGGAKGVVHRKCDDAHKTEYGELAQLGAQAVAKR
jgi:hypothetical protein